MVRRRGVRHSIVAVSLCAVALGGLAGLSESPAGATLAGCTTACVSIGDVSVVEGDSGTRTMVFPVTLSRPASATVSMKVRLQNLTASGAKTVSAGVDFLDKGALPSTVVFKAGANGTPVSKNVAVKIVGDTTVEGNETLRATLSALSGPARLRRPAAYGTIIDDDAGSGVRVAVGDTSVTEGDTGKTRTLAFPVTLSAPATSPVTLSYTITPVNAGFSTTAAGGGDYGGAQHGTVRFALTLSGVTPTQKSIAVPVWADTTLESDETVTFAVSAGSLPPGVSIQRGSATGTIVDDDGTGTAVPVPNSMAALGDSISRAFDACPTFGECLSAVWSSGTDAGVDSHYSRLLALNPAIADNAHNDAVSGAVMASLNGQAVNAVNQSVEYVTIEMGGNDGCKGTEAEMTLVATYRSQFQQAMTTLTNGLPNAHILVASVPDLFRLWTVGKDSSAARSAWTQFNICQSMVANPQSTAPADVDRRARVRQRVIDYNTALATVCGQYANCRFDQNAVFDSPFALSDISTVDYFHPSYAGQTGLAVLTYAAGYDW